MKTIISKGLRGAWEARTEVETSDGRLLQIGTYKLSSGRLATVATSWKRSADGIGITHAMFSDFDETIETSTPKRVTETVVRSQHDNALRQIEAIKARAVAFYAAKVAA